MDVAPTKKLLATRSSVDASNGKAAMTKLINLSSSNIILFFAELSLTNLLDYSSEYNITLPACDEGDRLSVMYSASTILEPMKFDKKVLLGDVQKNGEDTNPFLLLDVHTPQNELTVKVPEQVRPIWEDINNVPVIVDLPVAKIVQKRSLRKNVYVAVPEVQQDSRKKDYCIVRTLIKYT